MPSDEKLAEIKRILIIRFSSLGDLVLLSPLLRECRKVFPNSRVDLLTSKEFSELHQFNPNLDEVISYDRKLKSKSQWRDLTSKLSENSYDLILDAHQSLRSKLLLRLIKKKSTKVEKIDKRSFERNLLLSLKLSILRNWPSQRDAYCNLLSKYYGAELGTSTEIFIGEGISSRIQELLQKDSLRAGKTIAIAPGASFKGKKWPKEYYLELCKLLENKGYDLVLLGGKADVEAKFLYERLGNAKDYSGVLSFLESVELLKYCDLTISNDSAVVHFSESVNTPAFVFFGPTVKEFGFAPFLEESFIFEDSLGCRPCSRNGKGECYNPNFRECLYNIKPEKVFQKVEYFFDLRE